MMTLPKPADVELDDPYLHAMWSDEDFTFCNKDFTNATSEWDDSLTLDDVSCPTCLSKMPYRSGGIIKFGDKK